jgi:hypothetical protein
MRKFRASMEPFWDLKIGKYVEYIMRVSSEYFTNSVLPSLISTAGRTTCVFLAYVIPWMNKVSLALYIAHIIAQRATTDQSELWKLYCTVEFVPVIEALKLVTNEVDSQFQTPSCASMRHCVRTKLTTFYHIPYRGKFRWWKISWKCLLPLFVILNQFLISPCGDYTHIDRSAISWFIFSRCPTYLRKTQNFAPCENFPP